ncbi:MAG TPA: DUF6588 family protein [bacterium]|nr:DUF6588 family protein [bacterium]
MISAKTLRPFLAAGLLILAFPPSRGFGQAPPPQVQSFITQATTDFQSLSDYVNGTFSRSMGFYSTLGWNNPPQVFDLLGGPHFEIGFGAGADVIGLPNLGSVSLGALLLQSGINIPAVIPVPFPFATARVGLLNGLDAGVRVTYLPNVTIPEIGFAANFTGWGLDLRYKILDGAMLPTVTVGVSYDTLQGGFSVKTDMKQSTTYDYSGTGYNLDLTGTSVYAMSWNVRSFGAKLLVGKSLGMIFPFAAVGFQRNAGDISSNITATGTVTETSTSSSYPISATVNSDAGPVIFEPKYVFGFDLGEGLHWAVVGESNGTDIAGSTSFRVQF